MDLSYVEELTLRQVQIVHAVLRAGGNVNQAAGVLGLKVGRVTEIVDKIERRFGLGLIVRRKRGNTSRLTPEGEELAKYIDSILENSERLQEKIHRIKSKEDATLRVASVPSIAAAMMPDAIGEMLKRHPKLGIEFDIVKYEEAMRYLDDRRGEAVAMSYQLDDIAGLTCEALGQARLCCIVPPGHELARRSGPIDPKELLKYRLIGIDASDRYGAALAGVMNTHRYAAQLAAPIIAAGDTYDPSIKVRFAASIISLVKRKLGIAIIDEFSIAGQEAGLVKLNFSKPHFIVAHVVYKREISDTCREFFEILKGRMAELSERH